MRRRHEDGPDFHNYHGDIDAAAWNPLARPRRALWIRPTLKGPRPMTDAERREFPPRVEVRRRIK